MSVVVNIDRNVFRPGGERQRVVQAWRQGLAAGDLVPEALRGSGTRVYRNGVALDNDAPIADDETLSMVVQPGDPATIATYVFVLVASYLVTKALLPKPPPQGKSDDSSPLFGFTGIRANRTEGAVIPAYYGRMRVGGQLIGERVESRGGLGSFYSALVSYGQGPIYRLMGRTVDTEPDRPLRSGDANNPLPRGWLYVNDTDAADIEGVEVHVRLGTLEQALVPGFEFTTQTVTVGTNLKGPAADSDAQPQYIFGSANLDPLTAQGGGSSTPLWDTYGTIYAMLGTADEFTVVIELTQGLYGVTAAGALGAWAFALAVRYQELDGSGTPITTGGPEGDGWIRLRALPLVVRLSQSALTFDFRFPFYDPQTYVHPPLSLALQLNSSGTAEAAYAQSTDFVPLALMGGPALAPVLAAFSLAVWAAVRPTDPTQVGASVDFNDLTTDAPVVWWGNTGAGVKGGIYLAYSRRTFTIAPGHTRVRIVPIFRLYKADGTFNEFYERVGILGDPTYQVQLESNATPGGGVGTYFAPMNVWTRTVVTYKPAAQGALDRVRIYGDGVLVYEALGTFAASFPLVNTSPLGVTFFVGRNATPDHFKGWMDELVLWQGEMTPDDVRVDYNGGQGRSTPPDIIFASGSITQTRLVPLHIWHFDTLQGADDGRGPGDQLVNSGAITPNTPLTTVYGGATLEKITFGPTYGHRTFIEQAVAGNARKRGRFRVQTMRGLADVQTGTRFDDARWRDLQLHTDDGFTYPTSPALGIRVPASEEVNGGAPELSAVGDFRILPEWDTLSTLSPSFAQRFSSNPAWVALDIVLSVEFGLGWIFAPEDVDVLSFLDWALYCDQPVYDMRGHRLTWGQWTDMRYDVIGVLGPVIQVFLSTLNVPAHWKVGQFLGWYGLPPITAGGGPFQDSNAQANGGGGYEILQIIDSAGVTTVYCKWTGASPPWNIATNLSTQVTGALTGTVEGRERRFQYDGGLDTANSAWDKLVEICATARAIPIRDGRRLRVRVERPRVPIDVVTLEQVLVGSFKYNYLSPVIADNAIDVSFVDRDLNYERSTASNEHPSVQDVSSLSSLRHKSYSLEGVVRRTQVMRHIRYLLNRAYLIRRTAGLTGSIDLVGREPGDVMTIAHDVAARGVGGRVLDGSSPTELLLDRLVQLVAGHSYRIQVRYASDPEGTVPTVRDIDLGATGTGPVMGWLGQQVTVTAGMQVPSKDDVFLLYEVGKDLKMSFDSLSLTRDLRRECSLSEYVDEVYNVEGIDDLPDLGDSFQEQLLAAPNGGTVPPAPESASLVEFTTLDRDGRHRVGVTATWTASVTDVGVAAYEVHAQVDDGLRALMTTVSGQSLSASFYLPNALAGSRVRVWIVPRAVSGARRLPERGAAAGLVCAAVPPPPAAPSFFIAQIVGDLAVYSWATVDGAASYDLKRGGWILGQPVATAVSGQSSFGPTPSWVSQAAGVPAILAQPRYFFRARSSLGAYSDAVIFPWTPRAIDSAALTDLIATAFSSQSWEVFGDKWKWDGATTPNATLTNLQRNAGLWLEFAGSALTATYETALPDFQKGDKPEIVYVSAFANADQVHPNTWATALGTWGDSDQWTWEGPINLVDDGDDIGTCTLAIEVRFLDETYTWGNWQAYRPGKFQLVAAQFRLQVTRPTVDFDVRIRRFSTDLLRAPRPRWDRSPLKQFAEGRTLRNG